MKRSLTDYDRPLLDPSLKTGLILCGMGGPDGPDAVEPFLRNLFRDPEIFPLPKFIAGFVGAMIAKRRAPKVQEDYASLADDSATTQLATTLLQSEDLAALIASTHAVVPGVAMRYWHPFPKETVPQLVAEGAQQFVIVPMYPQFSWATNGSTINFVLESIPPEIPVQVIADWHLLQGYLDALAQPIIQTLTKWAEEKRDPKVTTLMYVAHSLPESFVKKGDPYEIRTHETINAVQKLVTKALADAGHEEWFAHFLCGGTEPHLAYQSKVGPITWLGPEAVIETERLGGLGVHNLCLQPVSFTCEHIETNLELDIELREIADEAGITDFQRGAALNQNEGWLRDLAHLVTSKAFAAKEGALVGDA
ncbi:MAG: ferrochelatase [Candidatus Krumholzibacteriia bacterium]